MLSAFYESYKSQKIFKLFYFAFGAYALPFISLLIFLIDQFTVNCTEMLFWVIFLVALVPCGLTGLVLSTWGLVKAFKRKSMLNKIIGSVGVLFGLGGIAAGVLGFMLIYIAVR